MKESLEAALARLPEATAAMNRLTNIVERQANVVERLVDVVGRIDGKIETHDLSWQNDLRKIGAEHTDVVAELREIKGDLKDALEIRGKKEKEPHWLTALRLILNQPIVKFAILFVVLGLFGMIAVAEGWIKLKG